MLAMLFLKGSLIGFSIAMPIGPVGVMCIQHSLRRGLAAGLIAGAGAALADAFFGGMAGFGVSAMSHLLNRYQIFFQVCAAIILWVVGIKIFNSQPVTCPSSETPLSSSRIFLSTFALTLTNPLTLICFGAIYASLEVLPSDGEMLEGLALTFGVLIGAALWWAILTALVSFIGKKYGLGASPLLNRISGSILTGCGCLATFSAAKQLIILL